MPLNDLGVAYKADWHGGVVDMESIDDGVLSHLIS